MRGAELGDPFGAERSGALFEKGQGVPRNYLAARKAYQSACEAGYPISCARWGFLNELGLGGRTQLVTVQLTKRLAKQAQSGRVTGLSLSN